MEGTREAELQGLFVALRKCIKNDDFERIVDTSNKILDFSPDDTHAKTTKIVALIQLGKFDVALEVASAYKSFPFEEAYSLYRLGRFDEALQIANSLPRDEKSLNLMAQIVCYVIHI